MQEFEIVFYDKSDGSLLSAEKLSLQTVLSKKRKKLLKMKSNLQRNIEMNF